MNKLETAKQAAREAARAGLAELAGKCSCGKQKGLSREERFSVEFGFDAGIAFAESQGGWVSVDDDTELPPLLCGLWLVTYLDDNNWLRVCRANYYPKFTLPLHEDAFEESGEMNTETEEFYARAGWYEVNSFSDEDLIDAVIGKVIAYCELPQPYSEPAGSEE